MASQSRRFGELLREAREKANQTAEVMAILLSMEPEDYLAIEAGLRYPDDDTVRRLCMMMEWNYLETLRQIRNEMSSPTRLTAPPVQSGRHGSERGGSAAGGAGPAQAPDSLGARLREVRQYTGQSVDIIAALLHVSPEQYARLEDGEMPGDDLLRRISLVYNWNFQELGSLLRAEHARSLQPRLVGNPFPGAGVRAQRFSTMQSLCRELEAQFGTLPEGEQDVVLAQLELIRGTMARHRPKAAAPAPEEPQGKVRHRSPRSLTTVSPEDRKLFS